jgi:hypothetical protein
MISILSVSFRHLLPWNTGHPQGLFRNEEPLFIHMNTVEKRMEMMLVDLIQPILSRQKAHAEACAHQLVWVAKQLFLA